MAIDVFKNSQDLDTYKKLKIWKELCAVKGSKFYAEIRPWLQDNWKVLATIFIGVLVAYYAYSDCDVEPKECRDVSSSIVSMEPLLQIEQKLVQALDSYANELQNKVNTIRRGLAKMRKPTEIHNINAENFLGNPLNSFPMLRRLRNEWRAWEMYLQKSVGKDQIQSIHKLLNDVIDYDILQSVDSLEVLREMYDIQPTDWVKGQLNRKKYDLKFEALDAFSIAFLLFKKENYIAADEWYMAALHAYEDWDMYKFLNFNRSFIYESYVNNLLMQNRTELALMVTNVALENDANNEKLLQQKEFIKMQNFTVLESTNFKKESCLQNSIIRGCRGDYVFNASLQLFCYYNSSTNDFIRLAPFKVEEIFLDPIILLYHDIVNDDEIFEMKNISRHQMESAELTFDESKNSIFSYTTSKNTWICSDGGKHVSDLNQRIEDMIGVPIEDESLLVGNFGLGGFHKESKDCLIRADNDVTKLNCNASYITVLIQLTNVESGGATIFPTLELSAVSQKGTALVWYNHKNNMNQCDRRTFHLACPVVVGSKWFAIKWINFEKETFRKLCYGDKSNVDGIKVQIK